MGRLIGVFVVLMHLMLCWAEEELLVISVATEETDGYLRLVRSLKLNGHKFEIYGLGEKWTGGDVKKTTGGAQKINILKKELEKYKDDVDKVLLFTDSYDTIVLDKPEAILRKFKSTGAQILFGAESFCWPDPSLKDDYPPVGLKEQRFLNSGGFIGYATHIYDILHIAEVKNDDDDQLYYTKIFISTPTREKHVIKLDTKSEIFQNLNGALNDVSIASDGDRVVLYNNVTDTVPSVIHGNGQTKIALNRFGNYIAQARSVQNLCLICQEDLINLDINNKTEWPEVTVGIFIEEPTPFMREFFQKVAKLNYPKEKITILIHNAIKYHSEQVDKFITESANAYREVKYIKSEDDATEIEARNQALRECKERKCQYFLSLDSTVHLDNADTLGSLIEQNRNILSPVMTRPNSAWSNVWGGVDSKGFYTRSPDYFEIINYKITGIFNLPYVSQIFMVKGDLIQKEKLVYEEDSVLEPALKFAYDLREKGIFMYGTNLDNYGHLINTDNFNTSLVRPEMYEILSNVEDWANRYIRPDYYEFLTRPEQPLMPCPDVFWFPVVTDEFCEDLITMMETFGQWSGGKDNNYDPRLPGGYENVPTVDIHMRQVDWDKHWLHFLKVFVMPMQQKVFLGYYHDPPNAELSFVVRYRPGEQEFLKPHHDASTYTMNIALNTPQVDFQGGGVRFVRYDCNVLDTKKGWAMIHPGRLTHFHEGLKVTGGTRYIMVTFIDP